MQEAKKKKNESVVSLNATLLFSSANKCFHFLSAKSVLYNITKYTQKKLGLQKGEDANEREEEAEVENRQKDLILYIFPPT